MLCLCCAIYYFLSIRRLLGPNGAGKSSIVNLLTGFIQLPTAGEIYLHGKCITQRHASSAGAYRADLRMVRGMIGVCLQQDVLWDDLNVKEHLEFQCRHKGVPSPLLNAEVQRVALLVELDGDSFLTCARDLSGGEKRRLSIGEYFSWISMSEQNFIVCSV